MKQLADILQEKKSKLGGWAEIGRALGNIDGQLIGKYASGKSLPSVDFAVKWRQVFNEDLIELMFADEPKPAVVQEPPANYGNEAMIKILAEQSRTQSEYIELLKAKVAQLEAELKKIKKPVGAGKH